MISITAGDLLDHVGQYYWDDELGAHCYVRFAHRAVDMISVVYDVWDLEIDGEKMEWVAGFAGSSIYSRVICNGKWLDAGRVPMPFPGAEPADVTPRMVWRGGIAMAVNEVLPGDSPFIL